MHGNGCMVHGQDTSFSLGSCSPADLPRAEGSISVSRLLKLGFVQLDGLKTPTLGWCVHRC
jgi:hypothetical protein